MRLRHWIFGLFIVSLPAAAQDLQEIKKILAVQQAQLNAQVPVGTIVAFGGAKPPVGWKICNGSVLSQAEYPALFQSIGTSWGSPGAGRFNLPDLRGRFLRGVDGGAGRDAESNSRQPAAAGGNQGDNVGSVQADETAVKKLKTFESIVSGVINGGEHTHAYNGIGAHPWNGPGRSSTAMYQPTNTAVDKDASVSAEGSGHTHKHDLKAAAQKLEGGAETRPINANVQYIIKY